MFLKKSGMPEESELVMCTVTKIHYNSVFVNLDEYKKQGMIHISEISPGRIRNIRDFIKEGKVIVCKVLRINTERGHIDLSLRRVSDSQRRNKVNEIKQEQLSEKIIEFVANELKLDTKQLYDKILEKIKSIYGVIYPAFQDIVEEEYSPDDLGLDKKTTDKLVEIIKQRIKPHEVEIKGDLILETYAPDGVDIIRNAVIKAEKTSKQLKISYGGGGKYRYIVTAKDYKEAENILEESYKIAIDIVEKSGGSGKFIRVD